MEAEWLTETVAADLGRIRSRATMDHTSDAILSTYFRFYERLPDAVPR